MRTLSVALLLAALVAVALADRVVPFGAKVHIQSTWNWSSNTYYPMLSYANRVPIGSMSVASFPGYDTDDLSNSTIALGMVTDSSKIAYAGLDVLLYDQFYGGVTPNKPIPGVSGIPQNMVTLLFQLDPENPVILGELHVNSAYNLECSLGKTFTLGFGASVSTVCKDKNPGPSPPPGASNERAFTFSFFWSYDN